MNSERKNKKTMGFTELKKWLRHRHPMIMVDRIIDYEPHEFLTALLNVSGSMDCIAGHFPERAIYPGSNLIQAFSQCGIILLQLCSSKLKDDEVTVVGSINTRFYKVVVPGDTVILHLKVDKQIQNLFYFSGTATVEGERVCAFKFSIARMLVKDLGDPLW